MKQPINDSKLVAFCGLYCGSCKKYLADKCPGCANNIKATWCKLRTCCMSKNIKSCAECSEYGDINECKKFNNVFSKLFGLIFSSDRKACVERIKEIGIEAYAEEMTEKGSHTIKK